MSTTTWIIAVIAWWAIASLTAWIAEQKGRKASEGFFLAAFFSLLGLAVELCLPVKR